MHKLFIILILLILSNCQKNQIVNTHGIPFLDKKQKSLIVNKTNKNDVKELLGYPSSYGTFDNSTWIYIERTRTKGKLLKLGQNITSKNNVLALKFNDYGVLAKKEFHDINNLNQINFIKESTGTIARDKNLVYSFLSSLRQKINKPVKKNK
tara:strand:- start:149 stop:604 length:456 start_codon:yes stop_codon:yes gene_type:complete